MKALTLTQPWATLVALGEKQMETRSWSTNYRGPLAIHAAKALPKSWREFTNEVFRDALEEICGINEFDVPDLSKLPTGVVVACVQLVDVQPMEPPFYDPRGWSSTNKERVFGNFGPGRFAWMLEDVYALPEPIAYRGRQRLWEFPASLL